VAARHWKAARRYFPDDALGFAGGARVLLRAGRRAEAVRMLEGARSRVHNPSQLTKVLAEAAQSAGDWAEGARLWEQVRNEAAGDIDSYVRGHDCLLAAGRPDEAAAVLADGAMRFPRDPQIVRAVAAAAPPGAPGPA